MDEQIILKDTISNEDIRICLGVAKIKDRMGGNCLSWFGLVIKTENTSFKKVNFWNFEKLRRKRGRPG